MLWWLACSTPDPDLRTKHDAVEAFEQAKALLNAGDAARARSAFAEIPGVHPIIGAWEARAAAESGDLDAALTLLEAVVKDAPDMGIVRYNRAAYLARAGQPEAAGRELEVAIELGATTVREALSDADFAPHLDHEAFGFLAANALIVAVEPPPVSTFLGSEVRLTLRVSGMGKEEPVTVSSAAATGPVVLVSHTESLDTKVADGRRTLTWTWRVEGPGTIVLDPITVTSGRWSSEVTGGRVEASAPPDRGDPTSRPIAFPVSSQVARGLEVGDARWVEGRLQVRAQGDERLVREPPGPPPQRFSFRQDGALWWVIEAHADTPPIASVNRTKGPKTSVPVDLPQRPKAAPQEN